MVTSYYQKSPQTTNEKTTREKRQKIVQKSMMVLFNRFLCERGYCVRKKLIEGRAIQLIEACR